MESDEGHASIPINSKRDVQHYGPAASEILLTTSSYLGRLKHLQFFLFLHNLPTGGPRVHPSHI